MLLGAASELTLFAIEWLSGRASACKPRVIGSIPISSTRTSGEVSAGALTDTLAHLDVGLAEAVRVGCHARDREAWRRGPRRVVAERR